MRSRPSSQRPTLVAMLALAGLVALPSAFAVEPISILNQSVKKTPKGPWPKGDEMGMGNTQGPATWMRCAYHLAQGNAKVFELSYLRSNTMPKSPFTGPYIQNYKPTGGIPFTAHAFNGEALEAGAEPAAQATQMDALGHFAALPEPWKMEPPFPAENAVYYGGRKQATVKPTPDSPLMELGIEKAAPIVTTAVLLDAKTFVNGGKPMEAGQVVTKAHIEAMLEAEGIAGRGIMAGDVVYIRTGWGDHWKDPDTEGIYYSKAPGLAYDAAVYLGERRIVAIGMDTPFIDPVPEGMLQGKAPPAEGTPPGLPFAVHHHMLTKMGIHHLEHVNLQAAANEKLWTSCTMVLPLREKGGAGSAVRPVAIGSPNQ